MLTRSGIVGAARNAAVTFDPVNIASGVFLSNGNLTATVAASSGYYLLARSTTSHLNGKYYVELHMDSVGTGVPSNYVEIGVGTAGAISSSYLGGDANLSIGCFGGGSGVVLNSAAVGSGQPGWNTGDIVSIAVDINSSRYWYAVNGGNWLGDGTANPATGVGGIDISAITGPLFVYISMHSEDAGPPPAAITANFGATAFSYTPPSEFGSWAEALTPFPVSPSFSSTISTLNMTLSDSSWYPAYAGGQTEVLTRADGVASAYTTVNFPGSGYYSFTVEVAAGSAGVVGELISVYMDQNAQDHGWDPISQTYYYLAIQQELSGSYPGYNYGSAGTFVTSTFFVTAGTHTIYIGYNGGVNAYFRNLTIANTTGPSFAPEPLGTRQPATQAFSSYSIWNRSLGSGATWSGSSDASTLDLKTTGATINYYEYSQPIFVAASSDPIQTFVDASLRTPNYPNLVTNAPSTVQPDPPSAGQGGDAHINLITADQKLWMSYDQCSAYMPTYTTLATNSTTSPGSFTLNFASTAGISVGQTIIDTTNASALATPYQTVTVSSFTSTTVTMSNAAVGTVGNGDTIIIGTQTGWICNGGTNQDNTGSLGQTSDNYGIGTMLKAEIDNEFIPHMLRFALDKARTLPPGPDIYQNVQWPLASSVDYCGYAGGCYTGHVPVGSTIGIPPTIDVTTLGLSGPGLALARALQDYGAIQRDTGGSSGLILYAQTSSNFDPATVSKINSMISDLNNIILPYLRVMTNQGPNSVNGGGTYRKPLLPGIDPTISSFIYPPR
jgi:hypothetical protein